jgi:DNA-binding MarR family transcriptional regulator
VSNTDDPTRLGRVEASILHELGLQGDLTQREELLRLVFPTVVSAARQRDDPESRRARERAEASLSRAIRSLERKHLISRERSERSGRTMLRPLGVVGTPVWDQLTRAEEDLAAYCQSKARQWEELARRARARAASIRTTRSDQLSELERQADLELIAELERPTP